LTQKILTPLKKLLTKVWISFSFCRSWIVYHQTSNNVGFLLVKSMNRRNFLHGIGMASTSLAFACGSLSKRIESFTKTEDLSKLKAAGFGELSPTAANNTGETFLALPKGFEYNVIGKFETLMADGNKTPARHDGMATFAVNQELRIVRNHEVAANRLPIPNFAIGTNPYDETAGGGTSTLIIDPETREIVKDFVSLSGTLINCAGGATPWGSWISCEETTLGPSIRTDILGNKTGGFNKPHGYCFEVLAAANDLALPVPLKAMGRFIHEAIAVDPRTGIVYLTEDYMAAGFYRFLPNRSGFLAEGGVLQMLKIKETDTYDTRNGQTQGTSFTANWVTIDNPDPEAADLDDLAVYKQGLAKGAATFGRLEGVCADSGGKIYLASTNGGNYQAGQIWLYEPINKDEGRLTLVFESPGREILDMPDNICLRPKNDLLFICEDSDYSGLGGAPENYLRILTQDGKIADFAKNITPNQQFSEFAGSTFSPDGRTLFVNLQTVGATFAIWGDWDSFKG
jgi:secreted PhoX family phosphatase